MPLTPVEIRHQELRRSLFGYKRAAVDRLMTEVADSFELVWRERAELADRVEVLESELKRHLELEGLLRQTLVSAERAAEEVKDRARREAELIVNEAHAEARSVTREAIAEKQRVMSDTQRVQALLRSALQIVDDTDDSATATGGSSPTEERRPASAPPLPPLPESTQAGDTPGEPSTGAAGEATEDVRRLAG
jgi:cell division initiation protein